jgi:hypothetical protein
VLVRLQRGLETLYRIDTRARVEDFVVSSAARQRLGIARHPREQLLLVEVDGELEVGLFVDERSLANLRAHDPTRRLDEGNLADFLLAIEGVSHFVYVVWRARADRPVSALELELQAEIDKYVTCLLTAEGDRAKSRQLRRRLFEQFELEADLDTEERDRYLVANANAERYSASLEQRYVRPRRIGDMLGELRRFYRMSLGGKLDFIQNAA